MTKAEFYAWISRNNAKVIVDHPITNVPIGVYANAEGAENIPENYDSYAPVIAEVWNAEATAMNGKQFVRLYPPKGWMKNAPI